MNLLVDTNVFLDILLKRDDLCQKAKEFFAKSSDNKDRIFVSAASFKDIFYYAKKGFHDQDRAYKYINSIYSKIYKVLNLESDDVISAIYENGDFEDNCLIKTAENNLCDAIITRNVKDFRKSAINVFTPEQYLALIDKK